MRVADFIAEQLVRRGIRHVFGVGGANIEDMFAAVQRRRPSVRAVLGKHEHAAGTAADAYARLSGGIGVVLVTSGGGAMNLVHALAEARASRVPLLAIVGEPPSALQGRGAFQDTSGRGDAVDAAAVFRAVTVWCARVERADDVPLLWADALAEIEEHPGPAVLLISKDRQSAEISHERIEAWADAQGAVRPPDPAIVAAAARALSARPVAIIAGDGVARAGAQGELAALAECLDAQVAVTPDGRDAFDNFDARFLGVSGAMGTPNVARGLAMAHSCLLVGTRLPLLARQGLEAALADKPLISVGREPPFVASAQALHVEGELRERLRALCGALGASLAPRDPARAVPVASTSADQVALTAKAALEMIASQIPEGGVVIVDAGNTGAGSVHHLPAPRGGRWLLAMGMAGMGYSFGAAIGAALATDRRCIVLAGDGAFFMHGLDIHTAVEHRLPITYLIFNNRAHGMCLVRERLLLGENAGYNTFRRSHIGAGLGVMFPELAACDCRTGAELQQALRSASSHSGPSVIGIELEDVEIPPFAAFQDAVGSLTTVRRGDADADD